MKRLLAALTRNWGLKLTALCLAVVIGQDKPVDRPLKH